MKEYRTNDGSSKLAVLWTSKDKDVAVKMVFMYAGNAKKKGWFDVVRLIVWGPAAKLLAENTELQNYLEEMKREGVEFAACKACADMYGTSQKLEELGVEVLYIGAPFSDMLKADWKVLSV